MKTQNKCLDNVWMAWPFKSEKELVALSKWFKEQKREVRTKKAKAHTETYGKAFSS